jgi:hypothetical protein
MKKLLAGIFCVLLVFLGWYFVRDTSIPAPVTESENLNELLKSVPINRVDLGEISPDTLIIPSNKVLSPEIEAAEMLDSFSSTQAIYFNGFVVVMEFLTNNTLAYTPDGEYYQRINENKISQAASVTANDTHLYIYDYGNKVIHSYDAELRLERSFPFFAPYYTQGSIKINNTHLAYQREDASGFRVGNTEVTQLLTIADIDAPEESVAQLVPRIVPSGKHPGGFNNLQFSLNSRSDIVTAYPALPYLFVYRNFELYRNIMLVSSTYDEVDNPDLTPFQPVMGEAVRINNLMDQLYLMDNGDILMFSFGQLHHISLQRSGEYAYKKTYALVRGDNGSTVESISSIDESGRSPGTFYVISSGKLLIVDLPL